jgi:hypothetical protein
MHAIHLNRDTGSLCDITAVDSSSENVLIACQFTVDISTFPDGFEGVSSETGREELTVCLPELYDVKSLSLAKKLRDHDSKAESL